MTGVRIRRGYLGNFGAEVAALMAAAAFWVGGQAGRKDARRGCVLRRLLIDCHSRLTHIKSCQMDDLYQLVFISKTNHELGPAQLEQLIEDIHSQSIPNNERDEITGAMLWCDGYFCQALEGPAELLQQRFEIIQRDRRHAACKLLRFEPIETRTFSQSPLTVAGIHWDRIANLATALGGLGTIGASEAGDAIIDALRSELEHRLELN